MLSNFHVSVARSDERVYESDEFQEPLRSPFGINQSINQPKSAEAQDDSSHELLRQCLNASKQDTILPAIKRRSSHFPKKTGQHQL